MSIEEKGSLFPIGWRCRQLYNASGVFASLPMYWTRGPEKTQRGGGRGLYAGTYRGRVLSVTLVVESGLAYSHR